MSGSSESVDKKHFWKDYLRVVDFDPKVCYRGGYFYRNIVERSSMLNNDEIVFYTEYDPIESDELVNEFLSGLGGGWSKPKFVTSRRVLQGEVDEGLDISFRGSVWDDKAPKSPELTQLLDAFVLMMAQADGHINKIGVTSGSWLAAHIGGAYYDCMSCGMPWGEIVLSHLIAEKWDVNLTEKVYPGKGKDLGSDEWYTVADFLEATKSCVQKTLLSVSIVKGLLNSFDGVKK